MSVRCPTCGTRVEEIERLANGKKVRETRRHGTLSAYSKGCRCEECTIANREYMREYRSQYPVGKKNHRVFEPASPYVDAGRSPRAEEKPPGPRLEAPDPKDEA